MAALTRFWEKLRVAKSTRHIQAEFDAAEMSGDFEQCFSIYNRIAPLFSADEVSTPRIQSRLWVHLNNRMAEILQTRCVPAQQILLYYEEALRHCTVNTDPQMWATIHINIGDVYISSGSYEAAVRYLHKALGAVTQRDFPIEWALAHSFLCAAYLDWNDGPIRDENLRRATQHGEQALRVITRQKAPSEWAKIQVNLGTTYSQLMDSASALKAYQSALQVLDSYRDADEWTRAQLYIGHLYRRQFDTAIDKAERESHYADASRHYKLAQTVIETRQDLVASRNVMHPLGMLQFDYGAWQEAVETLRLAIQANSIPMR
jgi:tetratricopeptide (TPR) repeat protein